mgnify:CR=1 FL=1
MKKSVSYYISELLFLHDCVIIPDFGGFIGNKRSAILNTTTGTLNPPSKQVVFNKNLIANDGLLISYVSHQEGITNAKSQETVLNFSNMLNSKLKESKVLRIEKVGLFTLGREGNIIFRQDSTINYSLDNFGMESVYNNAVIHKREIEQKVVANVKTIRTTSRLPKAMFRAAAIVLPLLALSYLSISQQEKINTIYNQMASLNPLSTTIISEEAITSKKNSETELFTENIETPIIEEITTRLINKSNTFYIIAGAFTKQENAYKMMIKLTKWDYRAEIINSEGLFRVSYDSFDNREDAITTLNKIRKENKSAWLLY